MREIILTSIMVIGFYSSAGHSAVDATMNTSWNTTGTATCTTSEILEIFSNFWVLNKNTMIHAGNDLPQSENSSSLASMMASSFHIVESIALNITSVSEERFESESAEFFRLTNEICSMIVGRENQLRNLHYCERFNN